MSKKTYCSPIDIFKKIDPNFMLNLKKEEFNGNVNKDEKILLSSLNAYLYFVGSFLIGKQIFPKDNTFYFKDFKVELADLMFAFKTLYDSACFKLYYKNNLSEKIKFEDENSFYISIDSLKLIYKLKNKISNTDNDENFLNELTIFDEYNKKQYHNVKSTVYAPVKYNERIRNTIFDLNIFNVIQYINNFEKEWRDYYNKVLVKFNYYRFDENAANIKPLTRKDQYLGLFEDHLSKMNIHKETKSIFQNIINDKNISDKAKSIVTSFPTSETVYDAPLSISNIIFPLEHISVDTIILEKINNLYETYPHFEEVIDYLIISIKTNLRKDKILNFKPILLLGTNGLGKTSFINALNNIFNLYNNSINYGSVSTPAELSGLTSVWRTGQLGFIGKVINTNNIYNPIVILEEIDKLVTSSINGNVLAPLYDLLEKKTASKFFDNYLAIPLDFSYVNYISTANSLKNIDQGIIGRFRIFNIEYPKDSDIFNIVNNIHEELIKEDLYDIVRINEEGIRSIANSCVSHKMKNVRTISKLIEDILMQAVSTYDGTEPFVINYISDEYLNINNTVH